MPAAVPHSLDKFVNDLFGDQEGYVYCPTKDPKNKNYWQQYFFKWPDQKTALFTHLMRQSKTLDTYISPSIFKDGVAKKSAWKGTKYVWAEFDGNAPVSLPDGIPEPTIKVQSSMEGHEHWYWKLDNLETDSQVVESLSKKLTYTLDADLSGWDCTQVLRPPGTKHQASGTRVRLLTDNQEAYSFSSFQNLVEPPKQIEIDTSVDDLPVATEVIAKYRWPGEAYELFKRKNQPVGSRSSALTKLALHCVEMGMSNAEVLIILQHADDRWKKYVKRNDRDSRLLGIIQYARNKKGLQAELQITSTDTEPAYTLGDLLDTKIQVNWILDSLLSESGLGILSAMPGVGKSTLSLRMGLNLVLQKDFMLWKNITTKPLKVGFFSLEMGIAECKYFLEQMILSYSPEEQEKVRQSFIVYPLGYALAIDKKENQDAILDIVDQYELDFVIIDSLKAASGAKQEERIDNFFDFVNRDLRQKRHITVWLIHHNRKADKDGPKRPQDLSDLYGDTFIAAHPTTVLSLWKISSDTLQVINFKTRLAEETQPFTIKRLPHLNWEVTDQKGPVAEPPVADNESTDNGIQL